MTLIVLLHLMPVWLVSSELYSGLWFFQCLLSLAIVIYAIQQAIKSQVEVVYSVEDSGRVMRLDGEASVAWRMSDRSRVSPFLLWIELIPQEAYAKTKSQWLWVFRDSVSHVDYRRLSRIVLGTQSKLQEEHRYYG